LRTPTRPFDSTPPPLSPIEYIPPPPPHAPRHTYPTSRTRLVYFFLCFCCSRHPRTPPLFVFCVPPPPPPPPHRFRFFSPPSVEQSYLVSGVFRITLPAVIDVPPFQSDFLLAFFDIPPSAFFSLSSYFLFLEDQVDRSPLSYLPRILVIPGYDAGWF